MEEYTGINSIVDGREMEEVENQSKWSGKKGIWQNVTSFNVD